MKQVHYKFINVLFCPFLGTIAREATASQTRLQCADSNLTIAPPHKKINKEKLTKRKENFSQTCTCTVQKLPTIFKDIVLIAIC